MFNRLTCGLALLAAINLCTQPWKTAYAQKPEAQVGDTARNLKVVPPWTLWMCQTAKQKEMLATYNADGARELRRLDSVCNLRIRQVASLRSQLVAYEKMSAVLFKIRDLSEDELRVCDKHQNELLSQLKKEVEEKNKYKYRPTHGWLYIAIGSTVALMGIMFGVGIWVTEKK